MKVIPFQNVDGSVITVTSTATLLAALINTAQSTNVTPYPWQDPNADGLNITPEDGDIRVLWDGNTPTATKGLLLKEGGTYFLRLVDLTQFRLIRVGGTNVSCSIVVGVSQSNESTAIALAGGGGASGDVNVAEIAGTATSVGTGAVDNGTQRVAVGSTAMQSMGTEDVEGADTYTTIKTPSANATHAIVSLGGSNDAIVSWDGGTTDHVVIKAGSVNFFDALTISSGVAIQGKNKTAGSNYANLNISVW